MRFLHLSDVCAINMGQSPDSSSYNTSGDGLPFFQGNADFGDKYPVTRVWCNEPTKIAHAEDILISVRAPIGAMNYAKETCCIGRGLAAITPDKKLVSREFVFWLLKGKNAELNNKGTGSTFKAIGRKVLEEVLIPDISLEQQIAFATQLESAYSITQTRQRQLRTFDTLIKARFVEMFGDPVANSSGWNQTILREITTKIGSGATPRGGKESYQSEGISLIRSMNVHDGRFEYKDLAHITDEQAGQLENVAVRARDVFINITGASVARSCIVPDDVLPARVNQHVAIIRCKQEYLHPVFANNLPSNVAEIDRSAFWECPNIMITVEKGSHAAELLEEFGVHYTYKDNLDWLN